MIEPNFQHTRVVKQSIKLHENALYAALEPKFKRALQRDINLLEQVHKILHYAIERPPLPFVDVTYGPASKHLDDIEAELNRDVNANGLIYAKPYGHIDDEPDQAF